MKWQASKFSRKARREHYMMARWRWHRQFAWLPVVIDEFKADSIIVPRHWLWLEPYERSFETEKYSDRIIRRHRPYTGAPTRRYMAKNWDRQEEFK